ncbi:MAG: DUF308 domain-containing protein [Lachnospiraceae bacterium]|nr:DUF308 domain-containing protein [Lachnospiraceae bacterium]
MDRKENMVTAFMSILLGVLLITMRDRVIGAAITVLGVAVLISAVADFVAKLMNTAIVKAVVGVCILVFGWMFVDLALYILAAGIILMGLLQISGIHRYSPVNLTAGEKLMVYMRPVVMVLAGACLLFNKNGTLAWVFVVTGILLVIQGVMSLVNSNH